MSIFQPIMLGICVALLILSEFLKRKNRNIAAADFQRNKKYIDDKKKEIELLYEKIKEAIESSYEMNNMLTNDDCTYVLKTVDIEPLTHLILDAMPDAMVNFGETYYQLNKMLVNTEDVLRSDSILYDNLISFMVNNGIIKKQIVDGKLRLVVNYYVKCS